MESEGGSQGEVCWGPCKVRISSKSRRGLTRQTVFTRKWSIGVRVKEVESLETSWQWKSGMNFNVRWRRRLGERDEKKEGMKHSKVYYNIWINYTNNKWNTERGYLTFERLTSLKTDKINVYIDSVDLVRSWTIRGLSMNDLLTFRQQTHETPTKGPLRVLIWTPVGRLRDKRETVRLPSLRID